MKELFQPNIGKTGRTLRAVIGLILPGAAVAAYRIHRLASVEGQLMGPTFPGRFQCGCWFDVSPQGGEANPPGRDEDRLQ